MSAITADQVKSLRDQTGAGMMECKHALAETAGDVDKAIKILREKGASSAAKKAGRLAKEGRIGSFISPDGSSGILVEVNCETDFVAKNEAFVAFSDEVAKRLAAAGAPADLESQRTALVSKTGENIKISRQEKIIASSNGRIGVYIHTGAKVAVMVEVGFGQAATQNSPDFAALIEEISMQIAASQPQFIRRTEVPADRIAEEKSILAKQVDPNKPPQIREKIVEGRLNSFYEQVCLLDQPYIREPKKKIQDVLKEKGAALKDVFEVRRFVRFAVGE